MIPEVWCLTGICLMLSCLMLHVTYADEVFPKCEPEWFGTNCQYRCLCMESRCDSWGHCTSGTRCKPGYFGPACQYGDIVQLIPLTSDVPVWLSDGDDTTCNSDADLQSVTIRFSEGVPFSWFRVCVNSSGHLNNFSIKLNDNVSCSNIRTAVVDNMTTDIYCDVDVAVQKLILTGTSVSFLCSVYVSLGRNVASRKSTSQFVHLQGELIATQLINTADRYYSTYAEASNSFCLRKDAKASRHSWNYSFRRPQAVSSIIWRTDNVDQSSGIILKIYRENGQLVNVFEAEKPQNHLYLVRPQPISFLSVHARLNETLSLCEVFIFGETVCPEGTFGLDCASVCKCADKKQICLTSIGHCAGSCTVGFHGFNCSVPCPAVCGSHDCASRYGGCIQDMQVLKRAAAKTKNITGGCPRGFFGQKCVFPCPKVCNSKCDPKTGACLKCDPGYYGKKCNNSCSDECLNDLCDADTGICIECDSFRYGNMCELACGPNCYLFECNRTTGKCFSCAPGYKGDECALVPWNMTLFIILLFLIPSVIACFFCCEVLSPDEGEDGGTVSTDFTVTDHDTSVV